jgi:bifunctional non-homologous end joining protein LigD
MLATLWRQPFSDDGWLFEEKVDGFRTLLYWDGSALELRSRSGRDVTAQYPELATFEAPWPCVVDGEAVVRDSAGVPRFELMQQRTGIAPATTTVESYPVEFVAFDLLFADGPVTEQPIEERRRLLAELGDVVAIPELVAGAGEDVWRRVVADGLEGMMAKRVGSRYAPGVRSDNWRKVPRVESVRAVVGGFTRGEGGRVGSFGSLQVGQWDGPLLRWVGSVGTGFTDAMLGAIREALDQQVADASPFHPHPEMPAGVVWVEPQLVAMIGIKEWTASGRLRAPRFQGFTDDDPGSITWEVEGP